MSLKPEATYKEKASSVVFLILASASMLVLFLFYADWWGRLFDAENTQGVWLTTFSKWPWVRLPLLWSLFTVTFAWSIRGHDNFGLLGTICYAAICFVLYLTYPGTDRLGIWSDGTFGIVIVFLGVLHVTGALILAKLLTVRSPE